MSVPESRDAAWSAVHDPSTDAATLAAIAQAHPEFGDAIAQHPNAYAELRAWIAEHAEPSESEANEASDTSTPDSAERKPRRKTAAIVASVAAGVLLLGGGAAWAATTLLAPSHDAATPVPDASVSTPSAEPLSARMLDGPPVYLGEELDWFMPDEATLASLFPEAASFRRDSTLPTLGESEGILTSPEACLSWMRENVYPIVGIRNLVWDTGLGEYETGSVRIQQFPSVEMAEKAYAEFADTRAATCAAFDVVSYPDTVIGSYQLSAAGENDAGFVIEQATDDEWSGPGWRTRAILREGNVLVHVSAPHAEGVFPDAQGVLDAIVAQAEQARTELTEKVGFRE